MKLLLVVCGIVIGYFAYVWVRSLVELYLKSLKNEKNNKK